jgi:hypothetical protein
MLIVVAAFNAVLCERFGTLSDCIVGQLYGGKVVVA